MSFGIISLTTNFLCASSITLYSCSYSATFSDHAVSLSFNSFAPLHFLGVASMGCSAVALGRSMTWAHIRRPVLAMPRTRDSVLFGSDLPDCGSRGAFRHIGQCHRQLRVQFDVFVVFSVTAISPSLGRSERPFRDPLYQLPRLVLRVDISQPCSNPSRKEPLSVPIKASLRVLLSCLTSSSGAMKSFSVLATVAVGFPPRRFFSCSDSQWRWPSSGTTWFPAQLVEESSSSVAVELPILPVLPLCVGNLSARC